MGAETKIEWCHATFNPWWGCTRVDELCRNCYAETWDRRWGGEHWGPQSPRRFFGDAHWNEPLKWNRDAATAGQRKRVFCASMADVFEDRRDLDAQRARLWRLIIQTPCLDWLLLTKRPENFRKLLPADFLEDPPSNIWLGTSVGDRKSLGRLEHLREAPAAVRFVSGEPLLEDLGALDLHGISWWVVGGESGAGARPFDLSWARSIVGQCRAAGVPVFVKQIGSQPKWNGIGNAPIAPCRDVGGEWVIRLGSKKGGDPAEWPADLRVREFPEVTRC